MRFLTSTSNFRYVTSDWPNLYQRGALANLEDVNVSLVRLVKVLLLALLRDAGGQKLR